MPGGATSGSDPRHGPPPLHGDEAALFARYHERLRCATALCVGTSEANVEEACSFAWSQLLAYQPRRESVLAWLRQVARREAIRLDRVSRAAASLNTVGADGQTVGDALPASVRSADTTQRFVEAVEHLATLPPRHRQVAFLRAAGWRYSEIAGCLGLSHTRVQQLLASADERMQARLAQESLCRSAKALRLRELEDAPPLYLVNAIGKPPRAGRKWGGEQLRLEWRRLALAVDDYRSANAVTDAARALGPRTKHIPGRHALEERIAAFARSRGLGIDRAS